jgi:hypothetical protein
MNVELKSSAQHLAEWSVIAITSSAPVLGGICVIVQGDQNGDYTVATMIQGSLAIAIGCLILGLEFWSRTK